MKKILLMILAVSVIGGVSAQKKSKMNYGIKDFSKTAIRINKNAIDKLNLPLIPLKPVSTVSSAKKVLTSIPIATSGNVYMCLDDNVKWLTYNPELNMVSFSHRMGGPWGGTSGNIRVKLSTNFFSTKDSVDFVQPGPGLCRYPSNIIYNPLSTNTNPANAYSVVAGPSTAGTGWVNNFFGSQNIAPGLVNFNLQTLATPSDSTMLATSGFSGGSGFYHALASVQNSAIATETAKTKYYRVYNGTFSSDLSNFVWAQKIIPTNYRMRTFSTSTATYNAEDNLAFDDTGLNGFAYANGKDSSDNPYRGAMPIVFDTKDGGVSWTKSLYPDFHRIPELQQYIMPTISTRALPFLQWDFRPSISAGSTVDENNSPATVDANGCLHIVAVVEGLTSYHPDSLGYGYTGTSSLLFDLKRSADGQCWSAFFIDTLRSQVVDAANGGFGTGTDAQGWGHWFRISKSPDATKIFVTWTDTDPVNDTTNIMPEVWSRGIDVNTGISTPITSFATGDGTTFYMMAADKVAKVGTTYKIPVTYLNTYESGSNPLSPQKHYYLDGVQFDEADFTVPASATAYLCPPPNSSNKVAQVADAVSQIYPNPSKGIASFDVTLAASANITISATNVLGQTVYQSSKDNAGTGVHSFTLNTKNWSNGVYFYTVTIGSKKITKKLIVE